MHTLKHTHILYSHSTDNGLSLMGILLLMRSWSKKGLHLPLDRETSKETILDRGTPQSIPSLAVSKHSKTGTAVSQRAERERGVKKGQIDKSLVSFYSHE